jgi:transposase
MKRVPRRIFTEEFKKEAVRLFKQQDFTLAEVSRNLDIAPKSLKTWVALYDAGTLKASIRVAKPTPDQLRIRELERELA